MSDPVNKQIGDYQVLKVLGAGGMGRVYQVKNVITDRVEAMKVLLPDLEGHEGVAARFLREIKVLAALHHPNIAGLHTALTIDNQLVMIMEYVEGDSLSHRLNQGPIPVPDALDYLDQVLSALSYAHQQHVIHRDIKPANMMLTPDGTVKLMDFGIARTEDEPSKLTAPGSTLGSMNYMSPEQVKGEKTDERSDLYSLGISLYEMVTGEKPFQGDSNFSIMAAHINQAPTPPVELHPGLPPAVNELILTSIAKAPEQRFQTADEFRAAIQSAKQAMQDDRTVVQGSHDVAANVAPARPARPRTAPSVPTAAPASAARTAPAVPPLPAPPAAAPSSQRGLYMALGALVLLVVIAAAGLYLPNRKKAAAADAPATNTAVQPTAAPSAPPQPAATSTEPAASNPAVAQPPMTQAEPAQKKSFANNAAPAADNGAAERAAAAAAAKAEAAAKEKELDEIEHEIDQLTGRAGAVNGSLDTLKAQNAAAGYGLRGDIAGRQASMKVNLAKAQDAIGKNDAARAKRYADLAASDLAVLEKFLGR